MKDKTVPTIKGAFVNSHIKALRKAKGEEGVTLLMERVGKKIKFDYLEDVPVRDEIRIIEISRDIIYEKNIPLSDRAFEAGRLHFRNFTNTPLGKLVLKSLPFSLSTVLLNIPRFAGHVFKNIRFTAERISNSAVKITMDNNDYPLDHFRGLFFEVVLYYKHVGEVKGRETATNIYEYIVEWK
jgi:uncharacterized protein (TIGR02265 family)